MKIQTKLLLLIGPFVLLQACGPLASDYSARSLGKANWGANAGAIALPGDNSGYYVFPYANVQRGVSEKTDVGIHAEGRDAFTMNAGITAKHAFVNNEEGLSFAMDSGLGWAFQGAYITAGPIVSYKTKYFEPYSSAKITATTYRVVTGQATIGNNIWINKHAAFNTNVSVAGLGEGGGGAVYSAGLVYRF